MSLAQSSLCSGTLSTLVRSLGLLHLSGNLGWSREVRTCASWAIMEVSTLTVKVLDTEYRHANGV
jgi:hypothetical protein